MLGVPIDSILYTITSYTTVTKLISLLCPIITLAQVC